jgi:hypothetical protein
MSINLSPLKSAASTSKPWTGSPESNSSSDDLDRHIDVDDGNGRVDRLFDRVQVVLDLAPLRNAIDNGGQADPLARRS